MANLQGLGATARADINRAYAATAGRLGQDLVSRGLAGTTISPSLQLGVESERVREQGRLGEQLRREQLDWGSRLSGDYLAAQTGQQAFAAGLRGEELAAQTGQQAFAAALAGDYAAAKERLGTGAYQAQDIGFEQNLANQMGFGMMPLDARLGAYERARQFLAGDVQVQPFQGTGMPQQLAAESAYKGY
jgi:hypothetical protein